MQDIGGCLKLYYYRDRQGNFGDDLNVWLWPRLLPAGTLDDDPDSLFVGIGTVLGRGVPAAPIKWVMGSGTGYSRVAALDDRWRFMCVRGPMTAKVLGLPADLAATDPAAFLHRQPGLIGRPRSGAAFMPHHVSAAQFDWRSLCERAGIAYVDPCASVDSTLDVLSGAALVVTESLHGAIVADAFRIPWVPVVCYDHILGFKWHDWAASLALEYAPQVLPALSDRERALTNHERGRNAFKRALRGAGIGRRRFAPVPRRDSPPGDVDAAIRTLSALSRATGVLSTDAALARGLRLLDAAMERFLSLSRPNAAASAAPENRGTEPW